MRSRNIAVKPFFREKGMCVDIFSNAGVYDRISEFEFTFLSGKAL
ncbi:hypothetical protein THIOSC13_220005 [uncultured Thiomicrorhabdus sp.]